MRRIFPQCLAGLSLFLVPPRRQQARARLHGVEEPLEALAALVDAFPDIVIVPDAEAVCVDEQLVRLRLGTVVEPDLVTESREWLALGGLGFLGLAADLPVILPVGLLAVPGAVWRGLAFCALLERDFRRGLAAVLTRGGHLVKCVFSWCFVEAVMG